MKTHNFILVGGDTDGLAFKKHDESPFTSEERAALLEDFNSYMEEMIRWEDDGVFPRQLVVKTKNYVLIDESGKRKIKGSALKASNKEKALKRFLDEVIELLLTDRQNEIEALYFDYARKIFQIKDMSEWASKYSITKAVLKGTGTAQVRIREALKGVPVQEGDKVYMFFKSPTERCLVENFDGTYDASILLGKLYDTLTIFETVLDIKQFPNLTLKKNKGLLDAHIQLQMPQV